MLLNFDYNSNTSMNYKYKSPNIDSKIQIIENLVTNNGNQSNDANDLLQEYKDILLKQKESLERNISNILVLKIKLL